MVKPSDYNIGTIGENPFRYRRGGFCPVILGQSFQDGRYQIINKLGYGGGSTVWAARDTQNDDIVSLKFSKANGSEGENKELRVLQHLQDSNPKHPGRKYLPQLLDHFYHESPNGKHLQRFWDNTGQRDFSRCISHQLLLAVDCLHSCGIVHADINESNVLLRLPYIHDQLINNPSIGEFSRVDNAPLEDRFPSHLVRPFDHFDHYTQEELQSVNEVQLIDLSSAFFASESPTFTVTQCEVRPPERLFKMELSPAMDIWLLGCITFSCITGRSPFSMVDGGKRALIPQMYRVLGSSDSHWLLGALLRAIHKGAWTSPKHPGHFQAKYFLPLEQMLREDYFGDRNPSEYDNDDFDTCSESEEEDSEEGSGYADSVETESDDEEELEEDDDNVDEYGEHLKDKEWFPGKESEDGQDDARSDKVTFRCATVRKKKSSEEIAGL